MRALLIVLFYSIQRGLCVERWETTKGDPNMVQLAKGLRNLAADVTAN